MIGIALSAVYLVLALLNARGSQAARVITWVLSGILLLCSLVAVGAAGLLTGSVEGVDLDAMIAAGENAVPAWYGAVTSIGAVVTVVGYIAVIILLALPPAHPFFRKQEPPVVLPPEAMNS